MQLRNCILIYRKTIVAKRWVRFLIIFFFTFTLVHLSGSGVGFTQTEDEFDFRADQIVEAMTLEEKIGQLFMVYWSGTNVITPSLRELISDYKVGSVYISGANFVNSEQPTAAEQVASLTNQLQTYNWENNKITDANGDQFFLPLFLSVDHEGDGPRYTRIRTGMTPIPSQLSVGATWSIENAENVGYIVGSELSAIGINMLLGPVLDVVDNPSVSAQGNLDVRVFGGDPAWVGELGRAYIKGVHLGSEGSIVTVAKHFPGHGDSDRATDQRVAVTDKTLTELVEVDLIPFLRVTQFDDGENVGVTDAIMSSHIAIADTGREPVSLFVDANDQRGGLVRLLEDVEGFDRWYTDGFIVSDSLGVGAIKNEYGDDFPHIAVATDAFLAGNDLLILHNFVPSIVYYSDPVMHDTDAHGRIKEVIIHFQTRYQNDDRFRERVDNSVRKIVRAKLNLYPDLVIDSVLINQAEVLNKVGIEENYAIIANIAEEAVALIKPESVVDLPNAPDRGDTIVFIVHNFDLPPCEVCGDEWLEQVQKNFSDFLIDERRFIRENIHTYYFYRKDPSEPAGISTFLYGWYLGVDNTLSPITDDEVREIRTKLWNADWIVFIFAAGDCGPDAYQTGFTRCQRGRAEADTLHWFLQYAQDDDLEAKIVALAFGAPPWTLDATDAGLLDAYYGVFSQLEVFQQSAAHVFLREFTPTGASPIDVSATGYDLEQVLAPSSLKPLELQIVNESPDSTWTIGDVIDLTITDIMDKNGHPLIDNTPVEWIGIYDTGVRLTPDPSSSETVDYGRAGAHFTLSHDGELTLLARIGGIESEQLTITVQEQLIPTATPSINITSTTEDGLIIETPLQQNVTTTPEPVVEDTKVITTPEPTSTTEPDELVRVSSISVVWLVATLSVIAIILVAGYFRFFRGSTRLSYSQEQNTKKRTALEVSDDLVVLSDKISEHFSDEGLRDLCFRLDGIHYDNLGAREKKGKARELVQEIKYQNRVDELRALLKELRPRVSWE